MSWILQGNPSVFDVDGYVSQYPFVYWSAPKHQRQIQMGDQVFIWRSGRSSGVIAFGRVAELPVQKDAVKRPKALANELWTGRRDEASTIKVGVDLEEVRLTPEDGMISRSQFKQHPTLAEATIITVRQGTIFRLTSPQHAAAIELWHAGADASPLAPILVAEGRKKLRQHYVRERSRWIIMQKKQESWRIRGKLSCEICRFDFAEAYPHPLGKDFIEVHHIKPLASLPDDQKTDLVDLMLVCSNCHRMLHRDQQIEDNLRKLKEHFDRST